MDFICNLIFLQKGKKNENLNNIIEVNEDFFSKNYHILVFLTFYHKRRYGFVKLMKKKYTQKIIILFQISLKKLSVIVRKHS